MPLYVSWVDLPRNDEMKRFYVLDTQPGTARTLTRRHKRRWLIESFFKSAKHDFGLKETRLRTETGIDNWIFLVWLSIALALYQQFRAGMTGGQRPAWCLTLREPFRHSRSGKTRSVLSSRSHAPEHPRPHGENAGVVGPLSGGGGTSPPTRGKQGGRHRVRHSGRNIPAHTGKTLSARRRASASAEHPRPHGENQAVHLEGTRSAGTSPPTRGKRARRTCRCPR